MKLKYWLLASLPLLCLLFSGCEKSDPTDDGRDEILPPTDGPDDDTVDPADLLVTFTQAQLIYSGDDGYTEVSDLWELTMYTDMEIDEAGYPVGPGQVMRLSFNATLNEEQTPDIDKIVGAYGETASTSDFSPGTFLAGYMDRLNLPGGYVEQPRWSFFGDIPEGKTDFDTDLLREGRFTVKKNSNGSITVEGIVVGNHFRKRYFTYTGVVEPRSAVEEKTANSTLTGDITIGKSFTQARLWDRGDSFKLGDFKPEWATQYRTFELCLAASDIALYERAYPLGQGEMIKLDLFVPYESDVNEGVPAGEYTIVKRMSGGLDPSAIVPFNAIEGYPDKFMSYEGAWYITLDRGGWGDTYARIAGGTVKVERPDGAHRITFDLLDCNEPANRLTGEWFSTEPIKTYSE